MHRAMRLVCQDVMFDVMWGAVAFQPYSRYNSLACFTVLQPSLLAVNFVDYRSSPPYSIQTINTTMALVNYSDSEASDVEAPVPKAAASSTKPAFQKVVDRSNPGKIKVSLPQAAPKDKSGEPPTKRAKIGGGGLSGFNSFLPAPKNIGQAKNTTLGGGNTSKKGLGAGVSLKTGAAPGFPENLSRNENILRTRMKATKNEPFQVVLRE